MFNKRDKNRGATPLKSHASAPAATKKPKPRKQKNKARSKQPTGNGYWQAHLRAMQSAHRRLQLTPLPTFMTIMVIAIALSLPAALQVLIANAKNLAGGVEETTQLSLFLEDRVTSGQAEALQKQLSDRSEISRVEFISRESALQEFNAITGFSDALGTLKENPLPHVLVVFPQLSDDPNTLEVLREDLEALPQVALAQLDLEWIERLFTIIEILNRSSLFLSIFLTFAVLMVVGNTIRLLSQNYRDEIEVFKLVGATDAYVRRPFLYSGLFYGLGGSIVAIFLVSLAFFWVAGPVNQLSSLYQSDFQLMGLSPTDILVIVLTGAILGLGGSWASVNRYLKELDL